MIKITFEKTKSTHKSNLLIYDLLISFALPILLWRFAAPQIGDRNTILMIASIGLIYSLIDFIKNRQFNFIVVYTLLLSVSSSLISFLTVDTTQLILNFVWFNVFTIALQAIIWFVFKPVPMLYFVNGALRMGYSKENAKSYFNQPYFKKSFMYMALAYIGKDIFDGLIRLYFYMNASSTAFSSMAQITSMVGIAYTITITYWSFVVISNASKHMSRSSVDHQVV